MHGAVEVGVAPLLNEDVGLGGGEERTAVVELAELADGVASRNLVNGEFAAAEVRRWPAWKKRG